jgi:hypothetical protein
MDRCQSMSSIVARDVNHCHQVRRIGARVDGSRTRAALEAAGALLQERRDYSWQRQTVIASNAELRERELIKLADALRQRGVRLSKRNYS